MISVGSLVLRVPAEDDAEAIIAACADPVTARFLPLLPSPYTREDAMEYVRRSGEKWERGGAEFAITENGRYLGSAGVSAPDGWGTVRIGYLVAPWARGKGVASAVARALADWLLDHGASRVELEAEVENLASLRVAYRAGFVEEGRRRGAKALRDGRRTDQVTFARIARDPGVATEPFLPFFAGGELSDGVVRLTPMTVADAGDYHEMLREPSVAAFGLGAVNSLEDDERRCRYTGYFWLSGQRVELAIKDAATGEFAGHIQLVQIVPDFGQAMVGYSLVSRFRGRGFMTRSVRLLTGWAFAETPLHRIVAGTDAANTASQAVLERAGFVREGTRRELFPKADGGRADEISWVLMRPTAGEKS
ncbi:GNAT family N-acetyltransferase [Nonomuraea sp. SBT364]|uniref:GNAT family N-acetyltransferase n=1 Tax=Nonomuraea sp. SBT364 TaxID=1580530 RepID=UPI001E45C5A9|nr:GNAT family N-acetyltransferase [Nonomuraea sp. SBT364]